MTLTINGDAREIADGLTVGAYLETLARKPQMVVVERNGKILSRAAYDETVLADGDTLEIVQMMAGG